VGLPAPGVDDPDGNQLFFNYPNETASGKMCTHGRIFPAARGLLLMGAALPSILPPPAGTAMTLKALRKAPAAQGKFIAEVIQKDSPEAAASEHLVNSAWCSSGCWGSGFCLGRGRRMFHSSSNRAISRTGTELTIFGHRIYVALQFERGNGIEFDWDAENTKYLGAHKVTAREFECIIQNFPLDLAYEVVNGEERYRSVGMARSGILLVVTWTLRDGRCAP
jgi:uncharacterized DUF497 family protein